MPVDFGSVITYLVSIAIIVYLIVHNIKQIKREFKFDASANDELQDKSRPD